MTDEEKAIAWCEDLIVQSKEIMPQCSDALKAELAEQMEFAETALSTLRDRIARQNPRPLTLEELSEMSDTDWVWVIFPELAPEESGWHRAKRLYDTYSKSHYSKTWLAYRRPPERSENDG